MRDLACDAHRRMPMRGRSVSWATCLSTWEATQRMFGQTSTCSSSAKMALPHQSVECPQMLSQPQVRQLSPSGHKEVNLNQDLWRPLRASRKEKMKPSEVVNKSGVHPHSLRNDPACSGWVEESWDTSDVGQGFLVHQIADKVSRPGCLAATTCTSLSICTRWLG